MSQERLKLAIGQLELAVSRAESNGDTIINTLKSRSTAQDFAPDANYQALEKKHDQLKKQAAHALAAIETLIPLKGQN